MSKPTSLCDDCVYADTCEDSDKGINHYIASTLKCPEYLSIEDLRGDMK
jgi:hypothetical protein